MLLYKSTSIEKSILNQANISIKKSIIYIPIFFKTINHNKNK